MASLWQTLKCTMTLWIATVILRDREHYLVRSTPVRARENCLVKVGTLSSEGWEQNHFLRMRCSMWLPSPKYSGTWCAGA